MVFANFEGTVIEDITALHYATAAGKLVEAKWKFRRLLEEDTILSAGEKRAKTIEELIERKELSQRLCIEDGAKMLKGFTPSILEVQCTPSATYEKIMEMARKDRKLKIGTCTDKRSVRTFFDCRGTPYEIASGSELEVDPVTGMLTGAFKEYSGGIAKAQIYKPLDGDVVGNSNIDLALCVKAIESGNRVYVAKNGDKHGLERNFLTNLDRFDLGYTVLD